MSSSQRSSGRRHGDDGDRDKERSRDYRDKDRERDRDRDRRHRGEERSRRSRSRSRERGGAGSSSAGGGYERRRYDDRDHSSPSSRRKHSPSYHRDATSPARRSRSPHDSRRRDRDRDRDGWHRRDDSWRDRERPEDQRWKPSTRDDRSRRADADGRRGSPAMNGHPSSTLPPRPAFESSHSPSSLDLGRDLTAEEKKAKEKKDRLEAWRKEQQAKKALEEARARAQSVAAAYGGSSAAAAPSATPVASGAPTSINVKGLKLAAAPRPAFAQGKASALEDTADSGPKKKLKRFALPPIDPLMKPGAGGQVAATEDDEDGLGGDEDEDDLMASLRLAAKARQEKAEAEGDTDAMDVDQPVVAAEPAPMEVEEEEDELDAFMASVKTEVKQVDEQDIKRMGGKIKAPALAQVLRADSDSETEQEGAPDEIDQTGVRAEDIIALAAKKIKKKELASVDHSKIEYEPFRKDFYHEPPEVGEMTEQEAETLRMELDAIGVRGKDCPKPITKWSHCGLPAAALDIIAGLGYAKPTPIQAQAIPAILSGRDIIGVAKTGSGKTMAFLLPMFRHIKDQRPLETNEGPVGIVMTPTRELAVQIFRESKPFLRALGLRAVCVYGGAPMSEQIAEMKKTAEIVVATPGRMLDMLTANSGRVTNLRRVTYLVLDEADRMFDMGFEPQVMKIVNNVRPDRQTVLFSATFPKAMESLARKVLRNRPLEITVGGRSVVAAEIEQIVEVREESTKFNRLLEILGQTYNTDEDCRTLIFVDRQEAADDLLRDLIGKGYFTMSLHGGKDQVDRDATIADFKAGVVPIVTATSVAARGLDVKQLKLVINYDAPNHLEDYVHRAGRTGRAGNKGTCVTFITPSQDRFARNIVAALRASKAHVPPELDALSEAFKEKLASGKAQVAGSGFGGRGLERLESDREKTLKAEQSMYGEGAGADSKAAGAGANGDAAAEQSQTAALIDGIKVQRGPVAEDSMPSLDIQVKKGAAPTETRENRVRGADEPGASAGGASEVTPKLPDMLPAGADKSKLAQVLAKINAMAKDQKALRSDDSGQRKPKDPDATDFHAIVPINDFPQRARWRVTNKETMVMLIESTGASITNKGIFYEKGKEPAPGEPPKLQLLIESNNEEMVEHAVREIKIILLEATQAALEAEQRNPGQPGRYSVV